MTEPLAIPCFGDRRDTLIASSGLATALRAGRLPLETSAQSWLFGIEELRGQNDYGWDFVRELSLAGCTGFPGQTASVELFWRDKLLVGLSVVGEYQYLAADAAGKVWYGIAPEFEESAEQVFDNIDALMLWAQPTTHRGPRLQELWRQWTAVSV